MRVSTKSRKPRLSRKLAGLAALSAAVAAWHGGQSAFAADQGDGTMVTISMSGSTAMRNFLTSPYISYINPGALDNNQINWVNADGTTSQLPPTSDWWSTHTYAGYPYWYQLAPKNYASRNSDAGSGWNGSALRLEWHEQGSIEGIQELVADQTGVANPGVISRNATTTNPIWVNQTSFTGASTSQAGYNLGNTFGVDGQSKVQVAVSDVVFQQGFANTNGAGGVNLTPTAAGYGLGNAKLANAGSGNIAGIGVQGANQQLRATSFYGSNTLQNTTGAIMGTLFVANPGTGIDKLTKTDAQFVQTLSRFSNGASFEMTTRDVNSGTRNVAANSTGVDPSWAVGANDGGTGASNENTIGTMRFSNKSAGSGLRTTIQNGRMAIGTLSNSDAASSNTTFNASATPIRALSYADDGVNYVGLTPASLTDGSYQLWQKETFVTIQNPSDSSKIMGDSNGDVKTFLNNITSSVAQYSSSSTNALSAADGLLAKGYLLPQMMVVDRQYNGGTLSANVNYNAATRTTMLSDFAGGASYLNNFRLETNAANVTTGTGAKYNGIVSINSSNYLYGNFSQDGTNTRDLAAFKSAVNAGKAFETAFGAGTTLTAGNAANAFSYTNSAGTTINSNLGNAVVMGDYAGRNTFGGYDLYRMATGTALADNLGSNQANATRLTTASGAALGDQLRGGYLMKNAAMDYLLANATAAMKNDAVAGLATYHGINTSANTVFNKFDVGQYGAVDLRAAAIVNGFAGQSYADLNQSVNAVINKAATAGAPASAIDTSNVANNRQFNLVMGKLVDDGTTVITNTNDFKALYTYLNKNNGGSGQGTNAVLLDGDTNFDGKVDFTDVAKILPKYSQSVTQWSSGDFAFTGKCDFSSIAKMLPNYGKTAGGVNPATTGVQGVVSLGSQAVVAPSDAFSLNSNSVTDLKTLATAGVGKVILKVDNTPGDSNFGQVWIEGNGVSITGYEIKSSGANLVKTKWNSLNLQGAGTDTSPDGSGSWSTFAQGPSDITEGGLLMQLDFNSSGGLNSDGSAYYADMSKGGAGLIKAGGASTATDLAFYYSTLDGNAIQGTIQYTSPVPEPACLGFIVLGGVALMGRRRRRSAAKA